MLSTDFQTARFLVRNKQVTIDMSLYDGATEAVCASGTYQLVDNNGVDLVNKAVTIVNGRATVTLTTSDLPTSLPLSDELREIWTLTMSDTSVETVYRDAFLCRSHIHPVISQLTLAKRVSGLETLIPSDRGGSCQYVIDYTWELIINRLMSEGRYHYLILNAYALSEYHTHLALAEIFYDAETFIAGDGRYSRTAARHEEEAEKAWKKLKFEYDIDESANRSGTKISAVSVIYTNAPPLYWGRY